MIKTLQQALKMDREKFKVPRSVQQAIPIQRIWPDGVFQSGTKFSKTFRFSDINYAIASKEDKTEMFLDYSELLNALDSGAAAKITLNNRRINKEEFEASLLLPMKEDGLDEYRKEYNEMLLSKVSGTNNSIYQERYLTVSVHKKNIDEARTYFARVGTDIIAHLSKLSSIGEELDAEQRLQIFRDFFRADEPQCVPFDMKAFAKRGSSFKDWICPQSMEFSKDCFKINERFGRVLYMQDYASYVKDDMISELCDLSRDLMLSIDILPVPTDEAVREIQNRLLGVETNVTNWQRRQNANNNFSAIVPYDMELQRKETKEMLDDLTTRDQRMMFGILTMVHMADSKKQLDSDTESILSVARKHLCQMATLKWQQVDGLNTVLPYGIRKINALRTLTTESIVDCPILFLTAKTMENDITFGLGLGADDYLTKPFRIPELRARVNAHIRREQRERHSSLNFERIRIDLSAKTVQVDGEIISLTKSEYMICEFLARNKGQVFTREQIYEAVFSLDGESDNSTIATHIKNIRAKLNQYCIQPITTVWGIGYKWE